MNFVRKKGDIVYTNDKDGNTLSENGLRYEARYEYNGQNRMTYSQTINHEEKTRNQSHYAYDALGRRTITQNATGQTLRTIYDGRSFEVIREGETFRDGSVTTRFSNGTTGTSTLQNNSATGERYRWLGETESVTEEGYTAQNNRYGSRGVTLYSKGEAVAISYTSSSGSGRTSYLGKDILGSVRSSTTDSGMLEDRYEYDAFGKPYKGDLTGSMNLGYTGKPYDASTGLYNYGYRDYKPQAARFTTPDPIRDGNNWFSYVNNDPVNYIDLWGLETIVVITKGSGWDFIAGGASHTAVYFSNPSSPQQPTLYDPAGGFRANQNWVEDIINNPNTPESVRESFKNSEGTHGDDGVMTIGYGLHDYSYNTFDNFIAYHKSIREEVITYTIPTTPNEEARMIQVASDQGTTYGLSCAWDVSTVLKKVIDGIQLTLFPGGLESQLKRMVKNGKATKNCSSN